MQNILTNTSVVIAANDVNISIFKPPWLTKSGIFNKEELEGNIIITPLMVQIPTKKFEVTILPIRIQMFASNIYTEIKDDILRILGGVTATLPHTPYTAVGLNFNYLMATDGQDVFDAWNRKLFSAEFARQIVSEDDHKARFGCYFSYDVLGMRLKLDIKPAKAEPSIKNLQKSWEPGQDLLKLNFNFNCDVAKSKKPADSIQKHLKKWPRAFQTVKRIVKNVSD